MHKYAILQKSVCVCVPGGGGGGGVEKEDYKELFLSTSKMFHFHLRMVSAISNQ